MTLKEFLRNQIIAIKQYKALLKTEDDLDFSDDGIDMLAKLSTEINSTVENIGARRLHIL